jgi:hypothetical protein
VHLCVQPDLNQIMNGRANRRPRGLLLLYPTEIDAIRNGSEDGYRRQWLARKGAELAESYK